MSRAPVALVSLLLMAVPSGAEVDELIPLLQAQTVMVSTAFEGGKLESGSGVVLCQNGNQAFILTADHVLFGRTVGNPDGQALVPNVLRFEVAFFKSIAAAVTEMGDERVITKQTAGRGRDLLLLTVPVQVALPFTASLESGSSAAQSGDRVFAIGVEQRADARPRGWAVSQGVVLGRDALRVRHDAPITPGFSGGPLFDHSGALIGINVEKGGSTGAESGSAVAIGDVLETISKWLPGNCLQTAAPAKEAALERYRLAMRAIGSKDWRLSESLMRECLSEKPWEGGRVHLQGMRYTEYLPRFHLGLALYKQGRCAEALQEWDRSEAQRAIQDDKRYNKLKRLRSRCEATLRRQLGSGP